MLQPAWPHAPLHQLSQAGTYMVTAATYCKAHHFKGSARLAVLQRGLLKLADDYGWQIEAWAIFSNHYHFIAHSPPSNSAESLSALIATLHKKTASWVNRLDDQCARKVWFNYWETRLTFQRSYLVRLNYVHQNAVKHGLVPVANQYPWCSAAWFERTATTAAVKNIFGFKCDALSVRDDFMPSNDW